MHNVTVFQFSSIFKLKIIFCKNDSTVLKFKLLCLRIKFESSSIAISPLINTMVFHLIFWPFSYIWVSIIKSNSSIAMELPTFESTYIIFSLLWIILRKSELSRTIKFIVLKVAVVTLAIRYNEEASSFAYFFIFEPFTRKCRSWFVTCIGQSCSRLKWFIKGDLRPHLTTVSNFWGLSATNNI